MSVRLGNGHGGSKDKGRLSPLPSYAHDKLREPWTTSVYLPIPPIRGRRLRVVVPVPPAIYRSSVGRFGRRRGTFVFTFGLFALLWLLLSTGRRFRSRSQDSDEETPTLVFSHSELQRIWEWEIAAGHYPSTRLIPEEMGLMETPLNPGLPYNSGLSDSVFPPQRTSTKRKPLGIQNTVGTGSKRVYLDITSEKPNTAYPPRPVPGSIADLDIVMDNCDFSMDKYVRDCLEVLRIGGGLDNENHLRRGNTDDWKYIFLEQPSENNSTLPPTRRLDISDQEHDALRQANFSFMHHPGPSERPLRLEQPRPATPYHLLPGHCDPEYPRIFHLFWAGPFTDKPYMALLSFLYTQNLGLHLDSPPTNVCRPQFWVWINPGPAASVPNPRAHDDMMADIKSNPWAQPFIHPRFKDVIQFKLWNTTDQLDHIPEIKNEWRKYEEALFNSGGQIIKQEKKNETEEAVEGEEAPPPDADADAKEATDQKKTEGASPEEDMFQRSGTTSANTYDRLSVILSDMARFVLCHRFGGTYLDADTLLLRDWEELWGWHGSFAYRWSRLPKYNTAVLRMAKGSALGSFLFRTALRNGLDFHPMTVSKYMADARLEGLLLRLPDALFDSAWLNAEAFQLDRPAFPYLHTFQQFFDLPPAMAGAANMVGFKGFFRGAYAYHWHNFWWHAFDPARNWPDLGPQFKAGEQKQRALLQEAKRLEEERLLAIRKAQQTAGVKSSPSPSPIVPVNPQLLMNDSEDVSADAQDLSWAAVMKRTFEAYVRGEQPNMYGEWLKW